LNSFSFLLKGKIKCEFSVMKVEIQDKLKPLTKNSITILEFEYVRTSKFKSHLKTEIKLF